MFRRRPPTGRQSTLVVRANGVAWTEQPTLYQQPPNAQVFRTVNGPAGVTKIEFGEASRARRFRPGKTTSWRPIGSVSAPPGNVAAATITTLVDRPPGVSGVVNPLAASGGQDAQSVDDIRTSAPLTVITLGRAVSIEDYQIIAETYAGIAKASALWIPSGRYRGVFITVAAAGGEALPQGPVRRSSISSRRCKTSAIRMSRCSRNPSSRRSSASRPISRSTPPTIAGAVRAAVTTALYAAYSFAARGFGAGRHGRRDCRADPERAGRHRGQCEARLAGGDQHRWRHRQRGLFPQRLQRLDGGRVDDPAAPALRLRADDLSLSAASLAATALPNPAEILVLDPDPKHLVLGTHGMSLDLFQLLPAVYQNSRRSARCGEAPADSGGGRRAGGLARADAAARRRRSSPARPSSTPRRREGRCSRS